MIKEKNFIDLILTEFNESRFFFILSLFCLLAEAPNIYWLFYKISPFESEFVKITQSIFVSFVVLFIILTYTVKAENTDDNKNILVAFWFAVFTSFISICYYLNNLCIKDNIFTWNWLIIPAVGFSIILPTSLYFNAKNISLIKVFEKFNKHIIITK